MSEKHAKEADELRPAYERVNRKVEAETGFTRTVESVPCPKCGRQCPTDIRSADIAEGGFIRYTPSRVVEWATCYHCEELGFHEHVHREGKADVVRDL